MDEPIEIVAYRPKYASAFRDLNLVWIEEHFCVEPRDEEVFNDPEGAIISHGGSIFFAVDKRTDTPIGTVALQGKGEVWQLAKLAVDPAFQGRGIGRSLCNRVIAQAREQGIQELALQTNTILAAAIKLYEALGFEHRPFPDGVSYPRTNTYMVLKLT